MKKFDRLIDHILKVDTMFFLQCFLILVIADLANVEEEFSPDIFSRSLKIVEFLNVVSLSFEIIDKSADK